MTTVSPAVHAHRARLEVPLAGRDARARRSCGAAACSGSGASRATNTSASVTPLTSHCRLLSRCSLSGARQLYAAIESDLVCRYWFAGPNLL